MKKNGILLNLAKNVILPTIKITTEKLDMLPKQALELVKKLNITRVAVIPFSKHINEDEIIKSFFIWKRYIKLV